MCPECGSELDLNGNCKAQCTKEMEIETCQNN